MKHVAFRRKRKQKRERELTRSAWQASGGHSMSEGFSPLNLLRSGHPIGNIWSPKYYKFPINGLPYRSPSKKLEKSREKKIQAKAIQGHVPWLNLKKIFQICFSQYANSVGTLRSGTCARLKIRIPMHSISWRCPKIVRHCDPISLLITHLASTLSLDVKVMDKSFIIALLKMSQKTSDSFALFLDEFLWIDPEGISCSLSCLVVNSILPQLPELLSRVSLEWWRNWWHVQYSAHCLFAGVSKSRKHGQERRHFDRVCDVMNASDKCGSCVRYFTSHPFSAFHW